MDITLVHALEYDTVNPVSVEDLVKSLEANERLLRQAARVLCELYPGLEIEPTNVSVRRISQESPLTEAFAFAATVIYQKELASEVPPLIEKLSGMHIPAEYDTIVTILVMLVAVSGIEKAWDLLFPGKNKSEIVDTRQTLVTRLVGLTGIAAERILEALAILFTGRTLKPNVVAAQKAFAPTRGQPKPAIRDLKRNLLVSPEAVSLAQAAAGLPYDGEVIDEAPRTRNDWHQKIKVVLHAADRDKTKAGWAGHIPELFDDRIPMTLEKNVNRDKLFGKVSVTADVLVTMQENEDGDMKPKEMFLVHAYAK